MAIGNTLGRKWLKYSIGAVVAVAILLRLAVYLQAVAPYSDEACVIRNIYERNYTGLTHTLNYYQYAPPIFLWVIKASANTLGYAEYALRIYPFICGIAAVFLLYMVGSRYSNAQGLLYMLLLFAVAPVLVKYTATVKQYMPDLAIALSLVWLALYYKPPGGQTVKLFVVWSLVGSLAIWSSMPSVFVLAGVGVYYIISIYRQKDFRKLWFVFCAGGIWLVQFSFYYFLVLAPQANSEYLQNFHKPFFFYWPASPQLLVHDFTLLMGCLSTTGGGKVLPLVFNGLCLIIGTVYLWRNKLAELSLIGVPVILMLLAAALHQYTLIERVTLFAIPFYLILIGTGFGILFKSRVTLVRAAMVVIVVINVVNYNALKHFIVPMEEEDIKQSMAYLQKQSINGGAIISHQYAYNAYVYYTAIHPQRVKYASLLGAKQFTWKDNLDTLVEQVPDRFALLYSWDEEATIQNRVTEVKESATLTDSMFAHNSRVYIFRKNK